MMKEIDDWITRKFLKKSPKQLVWQKTWGRCWYCGLNLDPWSDYEMDHQTPKSKGGSDDIENIVPSCYVCNREKMAMSLEEYRSWKDKNEKYVHPEFRPNRYVFWFEDESK